MKADGSLAGFEGAPAAACLVLVAHLIQLLITFIGNTLTLTLLLDIWPEIEGIKEPSGKDGYEQQSTD